MLEKLFHVRASGSSVRTEILAGITTFMTMAYIIFVNPAILSAAFGKEMFTDLAIATCLASAFATLVMAFVAKYPIALAPGMGLNAFFAFEICIKMKMSWQVGLAMVFVSGAIFTVLTFVRARELIIKAIPKNLKHATAVGIGLFIAYIGLIDGGIVSFDTPPGQIIPTLGNVHSKVFLISIGGLLLTAILLSLKVRGAILIGIVATGIAAIATGQVKYEGVFAVPKWPRTAFALDFKGLLSVSVITPIIILLFFDMLDTIGTLIGVGGKAGFLDEDGSMPRINRALLADSTGTMFGALVGTSTTTSYIESASGVSEGGKTGLTSVVTAALFLLAIFFVPFVKMFGLCRCVTAPALIVVGAMMVSVIKNIDWDDWTEAIPAFLTIVIMPFTYSIATGLAVGFIAYPILKAASGRAGEVHWLAYLLAAVFLARYVFFPGV